MLRCLAPLAPLASSLSVIAVSLAWAVACTDKPKVARAGVGEPTPSPSATSRSGADSSTLPGTSSGSTLTTPVPTATTTASPTVTATGTAAAGNSPGNTTGNGSNTPPANVPSPSGAGQPSVLQPPPDLPSAATESELSRAECDKGNAVACMRLGAYFKSANRREDAKRAYLAACVRAASVTPAACKVETDPQKSNARGCYEAGLMMVFDGDKTTAKATLQCACDKGFSVACDDAKAL